MSARVRSSPRDGIDGDHRPAGQQHAQERRHLTGSVAQQHSDLWVRPSSAVNDSMRRAASPTSPQDSHRPSYSIACAPGSNSSTSAMR